MKETLPLFGSPPKSRLPASDPAETAFSVPDYSIIPRGMKQLLATITPRPSPWFDIGVIIGELKKSAFLIPKLVFDLIVISLTDSEEESAPPTTPIERRLSWNSWKGTCD